jgi:hypothetical protein
MLFSDIRSISVASSSGARELFTRFNTGYRCNTSSPAGFIGAAVVAIVSR